MANTNSIYNNEAIATTALAYCINKVKVIEYTKVFLILPFVLHEPTARKLRGQTNKRSLEEFIIKAPECFISFNTRYQDFLVLTMNALIILYESNVITINNGLIYFNHSSKYSIEQSLEKSKRAKEIQTALESLNTLLSNETTSSFYLKLKVQL